ncbi:MAG: sensor hybrid histidine kinase [Caulobacter sp.]|nr:sensor hybrid histidine kinase [Caulobacter sp.]
MDSLSALQSDDGRYRLLVDAITDYAIYMLDPAGRVTSWNAGAERLKGYKAAEIIGDHFSRFYTDEDRAAGAPAAALRTAVAEGRFETQGWRLRKDGGRFWAHVLIDPIFTPSGDLLGFAKVTRDLTERKAAEEALRRSVEQFRLLVQGVTDYAIYMLDLNGRVTSWNAGAQRIKGYRPEEIVGEHFSRFYTEEDRAAGEPAAALRTAGIDGRFEKEGWRVRKNGDRFWAHVVIDPIRDDDGEPIGFAKVTRDITERRNAQIALDQARQALFQSQKLDAIGQLTGGVAHDFNNLLMAVLGSLELLRKRVPLDAKATALLDNAVQGAQRGAALTQRMLTFARKQELELEGIDVAALVRGMSGLLQRSLGPSVRLTTRFPRQLPPARTDANQLETALLNLVVNARDALPNGGAISIEATQEILGVKADNGLPAGEYVRLAVIDDGEGMDEDTLARATEPFYTTKGVGKGTGLGLSMVHGLAEQSGGCLVVTSRLGQGTRVEIWLPRADAVRIPRPALAEPTPSDAPVRPLTVLAVDDDGLVLMNTAAMLEDLGHRAIAVSSAAEALEALREHAVDVVITDHVMPQMTGLELAGEIEARRPGLPVVLATGYAELPPGAGEALPRLAKPYGQAELDRILRGVAPAPALDTA